MSESSHITLVFDMWLNRPEILQCQTARLQSILPNKHFCTWSQNHITFVTSHLWRPTWPLQQLCFQFLVVQCLIWSTFPGASGWFLQPLPVAFFSLSRLATSERTHASGFTQNSAGKKKNLSFVCFFHFKAYTAKQAGDIQWECLNTELKTCQSILISDTT